MKRILIGITGGIGSGKSEVSAYLKQLGEQVICADEVAREIMQPGETGYEAVRSNFGEKFFLSDGTLDRRKLARRVFEYPEDLERLNSLLHPLIINRILDKVSGMPGRVFIDAALLIETGMQKHVDYVWVVIADLETRIMRVMKRDSVTRESVENRIMNQTDDAQRLKFANEIIENKSSLSELHKTIDRILNMGKYNEV